MKVKVKVNSNAASGTKLASTKIRVTRTSGKPRMSVKPLYQTRAQMNVHLLDKNGQPRARSR